jgi:hypothetical protein
VLIENRLDHRLIAHNNEGKFRVTLFRDGETRNDVGGALVAPHRIHRYRHCVVVTRHAIFPVGSDQLMCREGLERPHSYSRI